MTGRRTGATIVDAGHGSYLTCHERLGCTSELHRARRLAYNRARSIAYRRRLGSGPRQLGRTHGLRATYHRCTDGADGGPCDPCKEAERRYKADYRAARR